LLHCGKKSRANESLCILISSLQVAIALGTRIDIAPNFFGDWSLVVVDCLVSRRCVADLDGLTLLQKTARTSQCGRNALE
jgi:hypothetical protein